MTSLTQYGRLSLLGKLGFLLLLTFVLIGCLFLYLQTRHGFRHVVVPLAATVTGAKIEVQDGLLSLQGALEVDGLVYEDQATGIMIEAGWVALRVLPWSLMAGGVPQLDAFELKQAAVRIIRRQGPADESVPERGGESDDVLPVLPIAIEQAKFEDVTITVEHGNRRMTGRGTATLNHLAPGQRGNVTLQTSFLLERSGRSDLSGAMDVTLSTDVDPGGTLNKWNGTNRTFVRTGRGTLEPTDLNVLHFEQTLTGDYESAAQTLQTHSSFTIQRAGAQLGMAELRAAMDHAKRPAVTDVSLTMVGIAGDTLNLWLGNTAAARVQAGQFDAQMEAHFEGTRTSLRGKATGSGVRLRLGESEASPPVDLSLQHAGSFDSDRKDAVIDTLTVTLGDGVRTLLSGALDRPVVLHLGQQQGATPAANLDAKRAIWSLKLATSELKELRPWLALLGSDPLTGVATGKFGGELVVSMQEEGAIIDATGHLEGSDVRLREERDGQVGLTGPVKVAAEWKSRLTGWQLLELNPLTTSIRANEKQVATLHMTGAWRFAEKAELTSLNGFVKLTGLRGETFNPWLGIWSPVRIGRAQLDGHARITVDEGRAQWALEINGQQMQLRLAEAKSHAPPLNLQLKQTGEFDRRARTLRLDQLNVQAIERRRPVVALSLDQPVTLNLTRRKDGDHVTTGRTQAPTTMALRITRLGIPQLRPWVALAGSRVLHTVRGGALDADLKFRFRGTEDVVVVGRLDLEQVAFERGDKHSSAPITLDTEIHASVTGRSRVTVDSWALRALDGTTLLAQVQLSGSADSLGGTDLGVDISAGDLSELVRRLGLLTKRQQEMISGGTLEGDTRVVTAGPRKPLTITGGLRSTNLHVQLDKTHQVTQTIGLQTEVTVDGPRTTAEIQRMAVTMETSGAQVGTLTASGRWPLATGDPGMPAGVINVTLAEWESGPFVDFLGLLPGRRSGPLPITGQVTVTQEAGGRSLAVKGRETIGPVTVVGKGGDGASAMVHLEHDVTQSGDELQVAALGLTAQRPGGREDRVTVHGNIRMGRLPRVQLRGNMDSLDADWYITLTSSSSAETRAGIESAKSHDTKDDAVGIAVPLDLDVDLVIGSVTYRTLKFGNGRLVAKGDGTRMRATLEPTDLAGGSMQGLVTMAQAGGQPEFGWEVKGDALDLSVLTKALFAELEPRVTGRGTFTTSGIGQGTGETLRQSLTGTVIFDVADGHFIKSSLLEFLAEQTHIDEFRRLGFSTVHGDLRIKEGWVYLHPVRVDGPSVALEVGGKVRLDGRLDVQVQPKIGPDLSDHVKIPCLDQFAKTVDGFTVLPVAVTVKGTAERPAYGATVTPGSMVSRQVGALVGTIADLLTGCQGGEAAQEATEEALGALTGVAEGAVGTVMGTAKGAGGALADSAEDFIENVFDNKE